MAPDGSSITLTFTAFDIEKSNDELCRYDYLEVSLLPMLKSIKIEWGILGCSE